MIIGLCGRARSGKSELANVCEKYGYKKLSFATPLKSLCCGILDVNTDTLNKLKVNKTNIDFIVSEDKCKFISDETKIPFDIIKEKCLDKKIENVRDMLQFIGTDIIREYNEDWHVNRLKELIDVNENYVFDDVRFPNEKEMIESLGGDCWFITRTSLDNVSNHKSETSLIWENCWNKIIINDGTLQYLLFKWENFVYNYQNSCSIRDKEFERLLDDGSKDEIKEMSTLDLLFINQCMFTYVPLELKEDKFKKVKMNDDKSVTITYSDGTLQFITNQLQIEDLKLYL